MNEHMSTQMIIVSSPSKPFTYTAKSTPRRSAIINEYKPDIDALYATVEDHPGTPPATNILEPHKLTGFRALGHQRSHGSQHIR